MYNFLKKYYFAILLAVVTILSHSTYINNGFTWLDHIDIENKKALVQPSAIFSLFTHTYSQTSFYRPFISLFHSLDYSFYGLWAPGYHLTNLAIHTAVVIATYYFIRQLKISSDKYAFIGSLIVALHPANVYSIGLITYRTDPLAVLFMMLASIAAVRYLQTNNKKYLVWVSITFICALWSKETVLLWFPGIVGMLYVCFSDNWKKHYSLGAIVALLEALYLIVRKSVAGSLWGYTGATLNRGDGFGTRIETLINLAKYFFVPTVPSINDAIKIVPIHPLSTLIFCLAIIGVGYWGYRYRHNRHIIFILGVVVISILPATNIVALPRFISPHYLYFTTIGASMAVASMFQNLSNKKTMFVVLGSWCFIALYSTLSFGSHFRNDLSLFLPEVKASQQFREGAYYVGRDYFNDKKYNESEKFLRQAVADTPGYLSYVDKAAAANNLAIVLMQNNKPQEAEKYFEMAIQLDTRNNTPQEIYNLALTKLALNKPTEAQDLLEQVILKNKAGSVEMYIILAKAYALSGDKTKAQLLLTQVQPLLKTQAEKDLWTATEKILP